MKNRIVENWLTNSNERAYKVPFCQLLISKGYKLIHNTRDGPFEQGKDVIALDPKGFPVGFQLKGGSISLASWQKIKAEIEQLVEIPIIHPSIPKNKKHSSYLVTNGQLSEEVRREIDDRNVVWKKKKFSVLKTWVGGELLGDFQNYYGDYFPGEVKDLSIFLELFQENGKEALDKDLFVKLIESILPIKKTSSEKLKKQTVQQTINSVVVIASYVLGKKYQVENHIAIIDAWTLVLAHILALVEKENVSNKITNQTIELVASEIEAEFIALVEELKSRKDFVEGDALVDVAVYKARITLISGYLSAFSLGKLINKEEFEVGFISEFLNSNAKGLQLMGESMSPLFFNIILFRQATKADEHSRVLLTLLLNTILAVNTPYKSDGLPDPYHHRIADLIRYELTMLKDFEGEGFRGVSYSLKPTIFLMTKKGMRKELEERWLKITYVQYAEFICEKPWQNLFWRVDDSGELKTRFPNMTQSWKSLQSEVDKDSSELIPEMLKKYTWFLPLFLCIYPHRATASALMYLTNEVEKILDQ